MVTASATSFLNGLVVKYYTFVQDYTQYLGFRAFPVDRVDYSSHVFWKNVGISFGGYMPGLTNFFMSHMAEETHIYNDPDRNKVYFGHYPAGSSYNSFAYIGQ